MATFNVESTDPNFFPVLVTGEDENGALERSAERRGFDSYAAAVVAGAMPPREELTITRVLR